MSPEISYTKAGGGLGANGDMAVTFLCADMLLKEAQLEIGACGAVTASR